MKKVSALAFILLSIVLLPCYSQIMGVDLATAIPVGSFDEDDYLFEKLLVSEGGIYVMVFKKTPVGYKHCLDRAKWILSNNGGNFSKDRIIDDSMYPSHIEGLTDYQNMPNELKMSNAEVVLVWELTDEYLLKVLCNDQLFSVILLPHELLNDLGGIAFGNPGEINGGPDADGGGTGGGLGVEISFGGLGSRKAMGNLPKPNMSGCEITQKIEVKVEIQVDQDGKVISGIVQSATYQDNCIWTMVVEAVKQSRFSVDRDANYRQTGWIRYIIIP